MVMDLLDRSRWTTVRHETDPRAFERYEMRPVQVIRELVDQARAPVFVIKSLCELERISHLMDAFAPARTVWVLREFDDSVRSAVRSFQHFERQVRRLAQREDHDDWRGRGMSVATRQVLRQFASAPLGEVNAAALTWYYRNVLFFEQGLDTDPRVTTMLYEELVRAPTEVTRRLFTELDLPDWSPAVTRHVHAHSVSDKGSIDIDPSIRMLCEELRSRFHALRG